MREKRFNELLLSVRIGLIRLTPELKINDKNRMADALFPFPKRGAGIKALLSGDAGAPIVLPSLAGEHCAVMLKMEYTAQSAVMFREKEGTLLLMLHPLFSVLDQGKALSVCATSLYEIVLEMAGQSIDCSCKADMPDISTPINSACPNILTLESAVGRLLDGYSQVVFDKSITLAIGGARKETGKRIDYNKLEYAVCELLYLHELYGGREDAVIEAVMLDSCLDIALRDRISSVDVAKYHLRIVSEILKMTDMGSYMRLDYDGALTFKAYIPYHT